MRAPDSEVGERSGPERNLGVQPIAGILSRLGLKAADLVAASPEFITHKMVSRACKGRWLTPHVRIKIRNALNAASSRSYALEELFNYSDAYGPQSDSKSRTGPSE